MSRNEQGGALYLNSVILKKAPFQPENTFSVFHSSTSEGWLWDIAHITPKWKLVNRTYKPTASYLQLLPTTNVIHGVISRSVLLDEWTYWIQWAAVSTHVGERRVPPQTGSPLLLYRRAMWGREWAFTFFPPMISASPQVPVVEHSTAER